MARKVGQIVRRGDRTWLVRVYNDRDAESKKRKYLNRTIHGGLRDAQSHLNKMLENERDFGRNLDSSRQTLNQYLDRWLEVCAKPRLRAKSFRTTKDCCGAMSAPLWAQKHWQRFPLSTYRCCTAICLPAVYPPSPSATRMQCCGRHSSRLCVETSFCQTPRIWWACPDKTGGRFEYSRLNKHDRS
jgi:hypothetical protein